LNDYEHIHKFCIDDLVIFYKKRANLCFHGKQTEDTHALDMVGG